jgi:hypothetical protein
MNNILNCLCNLEGGCCGDDPSTTKGSDRQKPPPTQYNNNINLFKDLLKDIKERIGNKGSKDVS